VARLQEFSSGCIGVGRSISVGDSPTIRHIRPSIRLGKPRFHSKLAEGVCKCESSYEQPRLCGNFINTTKEQVLPVLCH
jgi:hypothetical protein